MYLTILIHGNLDIGVAASVGFVEETNDSSESTDIDWKWMAANGTMLQWSDSDGTKCKSFTIVETPSMEEDDIVACMWKMKELVKKEINSTAQKRDQLGSHPLSGK